MNTFKTTVAAVLTTCLSAGAYAASYKVVDVADVPGDMLILDIGPASIATLTATLSDCKTLVWNGPLGAFEFPPFDAATVSVAQAAAEATKGGAMVSVAHI